MMIKDFCVACQYRYLRKTLQTGRIEISLGNEAAQQKKLAIPTRVAHLQTPAAEFSATLYPCVGA